MCRSRRTVDKDSVVIHYLALTEALNAVIAPDETAEPETEAGTARCDVCQRTRDLTTRTWRLVEESGSREIATRTLGWAWSDGHKVNVIVRDEPDGNSATNLASP